MIPVLFCAMHVKKKLITIHKLEAKVSSMKEDVKRLLSPLQRAGVLIHGKGQGVSVLSQKSFLQNIQDSQWQIQRGFIGFH